jgi:hypothetical protein
MIAKAKFLVLTAFPLLLTQWCLAQASFASGIDTLGSKGSCKPPKNRELFHDYIDNEQKKLLRSDGRNDNQFRPSADDEINFLLTRTLVNRVDELQCSIENDTTLNSQNKIKYLRGIENLLKFYDYNIQGKRVNPVLLPDILDAYVRCMEADKAGQSIEPILVPLPYEVCLSVARADRTFEKNEGFNRVSDAVILKYCTLHPDQIFVTLRENPDVPFADSLIKTIAKRYPGQLYNYSQAGNKLGALIRNINDDVFVRTVARMARSKSGQQYFPFLDDIVKGKITIDQIDSIQDDSLQYYKLLVQTQIAYTARMLNHDTAFAYKELADKLQKRANDVFINTINGLHEIDNPAIRFRIIQPLTAEELYYLAVSSDGLIYTSSFVKGVYPLMMKKINNRADSLLQAVNFDKYRKFIKMAAGYNTLSNFLSAIPDPGDANNLMRAFVGYLERSDGLEDGVDVADSYASIAESIKPIANEMLQNVQLNYQRNASQNNKRGMAIYNILYKLFLSADSSNGIDLTKELGIPPVYEVPYKSLVNDSGRIIMQVFFYGEKSDMGIFREFVNMFNNKNWKVTSNPQWVCINSIKGKPVSIYANRALPQETGEDEKAQKALDEYLDKNKLYPSITIHRGHSYTAPYTIDQMFPSSKIVFLGSCGGYHLIHDVLAKAPDAHIIASKQIGMTAVNRPFFQLLTEKVRNGNNVDWIPFWKEFKTAANVEGFEDYIPPYKNLGALFIKAYTIAIGNDEENQ